MNIAQDISLIAKDMWACKVLGTSNKPHQMVRFREPKDTTPFGFQFAVDEKLTLDIEVHPTLIAGKVVALQIFGIKKDGTATLIASEVL